MASKRSRPRIIRSRVNFTGNCVFFFQAEDGIRDLYVTGVQTCALPISGGHAGAAGARGAGSPGHGGGALRGARVARPAGGGRGAPGRRPGGGAPQVPARPRGAGSRGGPAAARAQEENEEVSVGRRVLGG